MAPARERDQPEWAEGPPPRPPRRRLAAGRRYQLAGLATLTAAAVVAGALVTLSGHRAQGATTGGRGAKTSSAAAHLRGLAAAWVASEVSRTAVVSCDPAMCGALASHGVPAGDLDQLGPQTTSPLASSVVVATAAVRAQFGNLLGAVYAPAVLASFGSGSLRVDVRVIAPNGAAAYRSALHADLLARRASGAGLLASNRITASAAARRQLATGQPDARLIITIAGLASVRPLYVVAFAGAGPGAGPGLPLRAAEVTDAARDRHGGRPSATAAFLRSMTAFVRGQSARLGVPRAQPVRLAGGELVLRIEFGAPSPLGLLGPQSP